MLQKKLSFLFVFVAFPILIFSSQIISAQEKNPSPEVPNSARIRQAIESGKVTPQQVREGMKALEKEQVSPEMIKQLQDKDRLGTLTPSDLDKVKEQLEQKKVTKEKSGTEIEKDEPVKPDEEFFKKSPGSPQPPLEIFGHELFSGSPSTFAPITTVPVSNNYIIGPGDEIKILMWGRLDASYNLDVDNEGIINIPEMGPLSVAGLSFGELKKLIKRKVEAITGVNVNVSMGRLRTIQVFVLGEAKKPGLFTITSLATTANAILSSGGPTPLGSLRRVELKRQGKIITTLDFYDFLLKGDISADTRLMPGDVIFIPQAGPMIAVSGNVRRSAIYELNGDMSLENALNLAGGLKPRAYNQRIQIERAFENRVETVLDISYEELRDRKTILLQDGDKIRVFSILPSPVNAVFLYGNVLRPGQYAFRTGLHVLDLIPDLGSLGTDTYYDYALIKRYRQEDMESELIPFDLGKLLISKDVTQNLELTPLDEVYVFNKEMFEDRAYAVVEGQVREPGRYFVDEKMRLKDLFFKAGGFTRDAYLKLGHLYRTNKSTKDVNLLTFDLTKAMDGDPQHNLQLEDLDHIVVHSIWDYKEEYTVSINGMVNKPGTYPYTTGMTIKDLIMVSGNLKDSAYKEMAELVRYHIVEGKEVQTSVLEFNVLAALKNDAAHNMKLNPMDSVHIKEIPEWLEKKKAVSILGEVYFPGTYQIRKDERLSDIIERAGGYKPGAYLPGAFFTRETVRKAQQERINVMMKKLETELATYSSKEIQASLSKEDLAAQTEFLSAQKALISRLRETKATGRVVISLGPIDEIKDTDRDLVLEDGDSVFIPAKLTTINVLGAVYNPTALVLEEERSDLKYYLKKTGGPTENAEADQIYIIRADGTVASSSEGGFSWSSENNRWFFGNNILNARLYPGDTVLVPHKVIRPNFMRDAKDITQILAQIAVTAGVIVAAFN